MSKANLLDRRKVVKTLLADRKDALVVGGLGATTYDLAAAGDHARNFSLWGAMGGAVMIGLGLALAQPELPVVVITGDGEMLMGMGSLATIAAAHAPNLAIAVLDNAAFGETGAQSSHTGLGADLAAIAAACGWPTTVTARSVDEVAALQPRLRSERLFAVIRISPAEVARHLPPRDGAYLADRFRRALGVAEH
jgi:thiamine pyrophosphate-dependent acetolactate synthase large subunit-like protein